MANGKQNLTLNKYETEYQKHIHLLDYFIYQFIYGEENIGLGSNNSSAVILKLRIVTGTIQQTKNGIHKSAAQDSRRKDSCL